MESEYIALAPIMLQIVGLFLAVLIDPYIKKRDRKLMLAITGLVFSLVVQNYLDYISDQRGMDQLRTIASVWGYSVRPVILLLFISLLNKKKNGRLLYGLVAVNAAVYFSAFFSQLAFWIEDGHFQRGPLGFTCHIISLIMLVYSFFLTICEVRRVPKKESVFPLLNVILIFVGIGIDYFTARQQVVSYLTITVVSGSLFYYIWLHLQFVREHERALMAEQRIQIMMTQIQPHFLYNTLSTIQALCRIDPEKAFDTTEKFGLYLRQNIDSLNRPELIPIKKELEHTKIYADIEMIRFKNVRVEYDIRDESFCVPALTVQPLVENAIKHGVRIRDEGIVTVRTKKTDNCHEIVISDNGKGFDTTQQLSSDKTHIGIRNVEERVRKMCNGTVSIESRLDEGTTVTIRIPEKTEITPMKEGRKD